MGLGLRRSVGLCIVSGRGLPWWSPFAVKRGFFDKGDFYRTRFRSYACLAKWYEVETYGFFGTSIVSGAVLPGQTREGVFS